MLKNQHKVIFIFLVTLLTSCKECKNENPRARVYNQGNAEVSVQIKTSGGNSENINNVSMNSSSEYKSYEPGIITFIISAGKNSYATTVQLLKCFDYEISIDELNNIKVNPVNRNEQ